MNLHVRMLAGPEPAPHRRGDLQGSRARARRGDAARSARARRALHQGNADGMTRPLAIVDYGVGNLRSAQKAFECLGHAAEITRDPERIAARAGGRAAGRGRLRRLHGEPAPARPRSSRCSRPIALGPSVPRHLPRHAAALRGERGVRPGARPRRLARARGPLPARSASARCRTWAGTRSGWCAARRALAGVADGA